jgi:hypothetical protein
MNHNMRLKPKTHLGATVRDTITGFTGVVKSITAHLGGFIECCVQPEVNKDGEYVNAQWFPEGVLEIKQQGENKIGFIIEKPQQKL